MYYHDFINQIADALRERDAERIVDIQVKAKGYLIDITEMAAIDNLAEAAVEVLEA